jgi:hypothetical protein
LDLREDTYPVMIKRLNDYRDQVEGQFERRNQVYQQKITNLKDAQKIKKF